MRVNACGNQAHDVAPWVDPPSTINVFSDGVTLRIFFFNSFLDASRLLGMRWEVHDTIIDDGVRWILFFYRQWGQGHNIHFWDDGVQTSFIHYSLNEVLRT